MFLAARRLAAASLLLLVGCGEDNGVEVLTTGSLQVSVTTTGPQPDEDGYSIVVDGTARSVSGSSIQETFADIPVGSRTVELTGVEENCAVSGGNPRTVTVAGGSMATVAFEVVCSATNLDIVTVTTGESLDADGYTVVINSAVLTVDSNGSASYEWIEAGTYTVELRDVSFNCTVQGDNPRAVDVAAGQTVSTTFEVICTTPLVTIDGVSGPGEWEGATEIPLFPGARLLHQTGAGLLYMGVEIEDATLQSGDVLTIRFDNDADGTFDDGEDQIGVSTSGFSDAHSAGGNWSIFDSVQNGDGAVAATGAGSNFFELVHPLDSGDPDDFSLSVGSTVGFCVIYRNDGVGRSSTTHPTACHLAGTDLSGYATLVIGG